MCGYYSNAISPSPSIVHVSLSVLTIQYNSTPVPKKPDSTAVLFVWCTGYLLGSHCVQTALVKRANVDNWITIYNRTMCVFLCVFALFVYVIQTAIWSIQPT